MVRPKPKSKRQPVRLRHKIEKASAAKQRKDRKLGKKNPEWRSRLKKDPGIPNLFPYKEKILHQIEETRRQKAEEHARKRDSIKSSKLDVKEPTEATAVEDRQQDKYIEDDKIVDELDNMDEDTEESAHPMAALLASARARAAEYAAENGELDEADSMDEDDLSSDGERGVYIPEAIEENSIPSSSIPQESSRKAFDKIFQQVIMSSDVILYVLDARDPEGTRSRDVERAITSADSGSKRLILILNKIDLIPPSTLKAWLLHLRRSFPCLPLRAAGSAANAKTFDHKQLTVRGTGSTLFRALKSFAHSSQLKRAVTVGVLGFPNVGKSSVINALLSHLSGRGAAANACPTGAEAGVTKSLRQVKLDTKLKLLDSPGIVFPSSTADEKASKQSKIDANANLILLNAVPLKQIEDPVPAITLLLRRLSQRQELLSQLLIFYDCPPLISAPGSVGEDPTTDFLIQVARKQGRLGKGGVPNLNSAAMTVITDWRDGRIRGWIEPSQITISGKNEGSIVKGQTNATNAGDQKEIVKEWAKEFKIEGLWGDGNGDEEDEGDNRGKIDAMVE